MAHFFGYPNTKCWLNAIDQAKVIYAVSYTETIPAQYHEIKEQVILLAQPDENGDLQYCQVVVGLYKVIGGKPFGPQDEKKVALLAQAWGITKEWLSDSGLKFREAMATMPANWKTLKANAHFLRYIPEDVRWERA